LICSADAPPPAGTIRSFWPVEQGLSMFDCVP